MTLINPEKPPKAPKPQKLEGGDGGGNYHVQRMLPRHFRMLDLKVAGLTNRAIAEMLGCTEQSVGIVSRSPLFKAELNRRLKERNEDAVVAEAESFASKARITLEENAGLAATTQVELLDSEDDSVRLRSAGSILDRVLGKPEGGDASGGAQVNIQINAPDAQLLITALNESKEIQHGRRQEPAADSSATDTSENGQRDVHQKNLLGSGLGHREAEAQAPEVTLTGETEPEIVPESETSSTADPEEG